MRQTVEHVRNENLDAELVEEEVAVDNELTHGRTLTESEEFLRAEFGLVVGDRIGAHVRVHFGCGRIRAPESRPQALDRVELERHEQVEYLLAVLFVQLLELFHVV